jgi:hypothetical protein
MMLSINIVAVMIGNRWTFEEEIIAHEQINVSCALHIEFPNGLGDYL